MTRREFDGAFKEMNRALGINKKVNAAQAELYFTSYKGAEYRDWKAACAFCGQGNAGYLPRQDVLREAITAAKEIRQADEKLKKETEVGTVNHSHFTPQERLEANRGAYEALRQSRACRAKGTNCWDRGKVRAALKDSSKDEEIRKKYGDEGISPAKVFGTSFLPMKEKTNG